MQHYILEQTDKAKLRKKMLETFRTIATTPSTVQTCDDQIRLTVDFRAPSAVYYQED